jgi:hypothetical protein
MNQMQGDHTRRSHERAPNPGSLEIVLFVAAVVIRVSGFGQ